jgi:hypothetical protein
MIEDKELGLKIAENDDEAFWEASKKRCEKEIEMNKREIIINEHILILCRQKLEKPKDENVA